VDPILTSSQIILALQSVVSRSVDPIHPAVVSVCTVHGGTADNVIPDQVVLEGTTRYLKTDLRDFIKKRMEEVVAGICRSTGATYEFEYNIGYDPLVNNPDMTRFARSVVKEYLGDEAWLDGIPQTMGAEDFAYYLQKVPGVFMRLGLGEDRANIHTANYDFNDGAIEAGVMALTAITLEVLAADALPV
jgi:amidohydrolase